MPNKPVSAGRPVPTALDGGWRGARTRPVGPSNRPMDAILGRYAGYTLLFLFTAYLLWMVRGAFPIFIVAAVIAYAFDPVITALERRGYSRRGAVGILLLCFLVLGVWMAILLSTALSQAQALSQGLGTYENTVEQWAADTQKKLENSKLPQSVKDALGKAVDDFKTKAPSLVTGNLRGAVDWILGSLGLVLAVLVLLPIITLWFMLEMNPLKVRVLTLFPAQYRRDVREIAGSINLLLGRYVRGQMIICSLFGLLCMIAFQILGVVFGMKYGLVLGLAGAFLYILPYVGMATIATSAGLTAWVSTQGNITCTILAVGCCFAFNLTLDYIVAPRVLGKGVGLHPLMVIFALLCGAQVGGIFGMILAIPIFASMRVVAIYIFPQLTETVTQDEPPSTLEAPAQTSAIGVALNPVHEDPVI